MDEAAWEGCPDRECGEHRTTIGRAWCLDCGEWCYPQAPCARCELPALRAEVTRLRALSDRLLPEGAETRTEELERFRQHSVTLNSVGWRMAVALGDVPEGADRVEGNPLEQVDRLIAELERLRGAPSPSPSTEETPTDVSSS